MSLAAATDDRPGVIALPPLIYMAAFLLALGSTSSCRGCCPPSRSSLARKFGAEYEAYRARVRRYL